MSRLSVSLSCSIFLSISRSLSVTLVAELFHSLTDMEDEDDGVEFCWRDEDGGCL